MMDLKMLTPAEQARQLGHPKGDLGIAIAEGLNTVNREVNEAVFRRLGLRPGERVLELGFGNGHLLSVLMREAENLDFTGVEISETMVEEALRFNRDLVATGKAAFLHGSAEALPFPDNTFDKAFAVAVVYFWPEPTKALAEIRRVLRPGGISIIVSAQPGMMASSPFARPEFGFRIHDPDTLVTLHRDAGFGQVVVEPYEEDVTQPDGRVSRLQAYFVIAEAGHSDQ